MRSKVAVNKGDGKKRKKKMKEKKKSPVEIAGPGILYAVNLILLLTHISSCYGLY